MQRPSMRRSCPVSAVNFVEAAVRVDMGGNPIASDAFDDLIKEAGIAVESVTEEQAYLARRPTVPTGAAAAALPG